MYDVIFISYKEPDREAHWAHLLDMIPFAKRVDGVRGILNAHRRAAEIATTRFFWVVDGDNLVREGFNFGFKWDRHRHLSNDEEPVGFWNAENSLTGDVYGYGGIKLIPRRTMLGHVHQGQADITTSISSMRYFHDEVGSTTVVNSSAWDAWRNALRESAKLAYAAHYRDDEVASKRLDRWQSPRLLSKPFGKDAVLGSFAGESMVLDGGKDFDLSIVNDTDALRRMSDEGTADEAATGLAHTKGFPLCR